MSDIQSKDTFYQMNPVYFLGGLTFLFFSVQLFTGVLLYMNFIPTVQKAYGSLVYITNVLPYGLFIRTCHRYAAMGMVILCFLHMVRMFTTNRYTRPRNVGWISGVILLIITIAITLSGLLASYDIVPQGYMNELAVLLDIGKREYQKLLSFMFGFHILLPATVFILLIVHFSRIARPKIFPPLSLSLFAIGFLTMITGFFPISVMAEKPKSAVSSLPISLMTWIIIMGILVVVLLLLSFLPTLFKKPIQVAIVDEKRCTGCLYCAEVCPKKAIELRSKTIAGVKRNVAFVLEKKCQGCGVCAGACRNAAIQLEGSEDNILVEEVQQAWIQAN